MPHKAFDKNTTTSYALFSTWKFHAFEVFLMIPKRKKYLFILLYVTLITAMTMISSRAEPRETLTMLYEIRAPLVYRDGQGKLTGMFVTPALKALNASGIATKWDETPFKRQLNIIEANTQAACALGLFKTKERQKIAKFSDAIFRDQDRPSVMLAHRDFQPAKSLNLFAALSTPGARLLKKETASYGETIDDAIEKSHVMIISTTAESQNMAKMIAAKRADFILVAEDEAILLMKSFPDGEQLYIYKPNGMPKGPERYLMCSKMVSDELLFRFNKSLQ